MKEESIITEEDYEDMRRKTMKFLESKATLLVIVVVAFLLMIGSATMMWMNKNDWGYLTIYGIVFLGSLAVIMFAWNKKDPKEEGEQKSKILTNEEFDSMYKDEK